MLDLHEKLKIYFVGLSEVVLSPFDQDERDRIYPSFKERLTIIMDREYPYEDAEKFRHVSKTRLRI